MYNQGYGEIVSVLVFAMNQEKTWIREGFIQSWRYVLPSFLAFDKMSKDTEILLNFKNIYVHQHCLAIRILLP